MINSLWIWLLRVSRRPACGRQGAQRRAQRTQRDGGDSHLLSMLLTLAV